MGQGGLSERSMLCKGPGVGICGMLMSGWRLEGSGAGRQGLHVPAFMKSQSLS